jgi:ABC-2 type transport system ATP-binding protein
MPAIELAAVTKLYGKRTALDRVSLSLPEGGSLGLLGPNGAGKTTALRAILGLVHPSSGSVRLQGWDPLDAEARRGVGYLPERLMLPGHMSVRGFLALHGGLAGLRAKKLAEEVEKVSVLTGIANRLDDRLGELSKGLAQRVGFAQALLGEPRVLLLDEPSTGLDPIGMRDARDWIAAARAWGCAVLIVRICCRKWGASATGLRSSTTAASSPRGRSRRSCRTAKNSRTPSSGWSVRRARAGAPVRIEPDQLRLLTVEAVRDASRRRIVPAVLVISTLSLLMMDSCTSCSQSGGVDASGQPLSVINLTGVLSFSLLGLWSIALAGLLAADHLRSIFDDGSALLVLSRPVSRPTLALARLGGALAVAFAGALMLCIGATFFLVVRGGLPLSPALTATLSILVSSVAVAALAMTASLFLPRIVTVLLVLGGVGLIGVLNIGSASGSTFSGLYFVLDRFGPPLLSSIVVALSPWSGQLTTTVTPGDVAVRSILWLIGSVALLAVVFDQRELTKLEPR